MDVSAPAPDRPGPRAAAPAAAAPAVAAPAVAAPSAAEPFAAATIVARRTLPHAVVLARSFREHHPELPFVTLLADELPAERGDAAAAAALRELARAGGEVLPLAAVPLPARRQLLFGYDQQELSFALTPHLLSLLLARGHRRVVFLKQASLVVGELA